MMKMSDEASDVERLARTRILKELLQKTVETHRSYLKQVAKTAQGTPPQFITFDTLESVKKAGKSGLTLVTARLRTENGPFSVKLAIKSFKSSSIAEQNRVYTEILLRRLEGTDILTPNVILPDFAIIDAQSSRTLVYEGIDGVELLDSDLSSEEQMRLAGYALGSYHGSRAYPIDLERYRIMITTAVQSIPIQASRRKIIHEEGTRIATDVLGRTAGGCEAFGDFHAGNILVKKYEDEVYTYLIDPEFIEPDSGACRLQDVATFFIRPALEEFRTNKALTMMWKNVDSFFSGYDQALMKFGVNLSLIYGTQGVPKEIFSFQLGLASILEALFVYRRWKGHIRASSEIDDRLADELALCLSMGAQLWNVMF